MKKVSIIEFFTIIKNDLKSFLCIVLICAVLVGSYLGFGWLSTAFSNSLLDTLDRNSLHDLEIVCPLGITEENIEEIGKIEDIKYAEGSYVTYNLINLPDSNTNVKITSLSEHIDLPFDIEGELPINKGEIAVNRDYAEKYELKIGDVIHLNDTANLTCSDLKITAIVQSVLFVNNSFYQFEISVYNGAPCSGFFYASGETFDKNSFNGYPEVLIKSDYTFTSKRIDSSYHNKIESLKEKVLSFCNGLEPYSNLAVSPFLNENQINNLKCKALSREENKSQNYIDVIPVVIGKLSNNMGITLMVGCLIICVFAISRLIKTNKVLIGTQLSFGIPKRRITLTYCGFVILAAIIGCFLGVLIGRFAILPNVLSVMGEIWIFEKTLYYFSWLDTLFVFGVVIFVITLVAFITCNLFMKNDILEMLDGTAVSNLNTGVKGKTHFFKRASLINKSAINNLKTDKLRVFATVTCLFITSALLLNGFTGLILCPSTISKQFNEIYDFNQIVYIDSSYEQAEANVSQILKDENICYTSVYMTYVGVKTETGNENHASLIVADDNIHNVIHCYEYNKNRNIPIDKSINDFILFGSNLTYYEDAKVGKNISVIDKQGEQVEIEIGGFYKHHISENQVLISKEKYKDLFGEEPKINALLIKCSDGVDLNKKLLDIDGFILIDNYEFNQRQIYDNFSEASMVISLTFIILSVFIDLFMLINLFELNLKEKKREAVTLLMNGYKEKTVKKYIFSDTKFMLLIGLVFGLSLGVGLAMITISCIQSGNSFFSYYVSPWACVASVVLTVLLTNAIGLIKLRAVNKLDITGNNMDE